MAVEIHVARVEKEIDPGFVEIDCAFGSDGGEIFIIDDVKLRRNVASANVAQQTDG